MFEYYTIALIAFLGALSPGPDFVVVAKSAMLHNRRNALLTAVGIAIGILIHSSYCILGLALVIAHSVVLFDVIKYLGAAYLVYLGVKSLLAKQGHLAVEKLAGEQQSSWAAFRNGLLTNLLNPKCTLFLLSIFTMVVNPGTPKLVQATYGFEISFIALVWFAFLSCALTLPAVKLRIDKVQHIATKLIGLVLLVLAIVVVFEVR